MIDCVKHDEGLRTTLCIEAFSDHLDDNNFPNLGVEGICLDSLELTLRVDDMLSPTSTAVRCVIHVHMLYA